MVQRAGSPLWVYRLTPSSRGETLRPANRRNLTSWLRRVREWEPARHGRHERQSQTPVVSEPVKVEETGETRCKSIRQMAVRRTLADWSDADDVVPLGWTVCLRAEEGTRGPRHVPSLLFAPSLARSDRNR